MEDQNADNMYDIVLWSTFESAREGNAIAQSLLGHWYEVGRHVVKDIRKAAAWYKIAANNGHLGSMYKMGIFFAKGIGVPQDDVNAVVMLRKSAEGGCAEAQRDLAWMYEAGRVVDTECADVRVGSSSDELRWHRREWNSWRSAEEWYIKAAEQGDVLAMYALGRLYDSESRKLVNDKKSLVYYEKAASAGYIRAQVRLAYKYEHSYEVNGCEDSIRAIEWYKKAKDAGNEIARKRYEELWNRLMKCEETGNETAMKQLSVMYETGRLVEKDLDKAAELKFRSQYEHTIRSMERLSEEGSVRNVELSKRLDDVWKHCVDVAERGVDQYIVFLRYLYEHGRVVERDAEMVKFLNNWLVAWQKIMVLEGNALSAMMGNGNAKQKYDEEIERLSHDAENGDISSIHQLMIMYDQGCGIEKNSVKAETLKRQCKICDPQFMEIDWDKLRIPPWKRRIQTA